MFERKIKSDIQKAIQELITAGYIRKVIAEVLIDVISHSEISVNPSTKEITYKIKAVDVKF